MGVGIKILENLNISLLCKWWWRFENESSLWQMIITQKYFRGKNIYNIKTKNSDSPAWKGLMKVKTNYLKSRQVVTNSGDKSRFWHKSQISVVPLYIYDPELYNIYENKDILVKEAREMEWQLPFRRWLEGNMEERWVEICRKCENFDFKEYPHYVLWKWGEHKMFSIRSMYNNLSNDILGPEWHLIWKGKIPPEIKNFM
jgi:hypothetical protein